MLEVSGALVVVFFSLSILNWLHLLKSDIIKMLIKREFAWNDLSASTQ